MTVTSAFLAPMLTSEFSCASVSNKISLVSTFKTSPTETLSFTLKVRTYKFAFLTLCSELLITVISCPEPKLVYFVESAKVPLTNSNSSEL